MASYEDRSDQGFEQNALGGIRFVNDCLEMAKAHPVFKPDKRHLGHSHRRVKSALDPTFEQKVYEECNNRGLDIYDLREALFYVYDVKHHCQMTLIFKRTRLNIYLTVQSFIDTYVAPMKRKDGVIADVWELECVFEELLAMETVLNILIESL